MCHILDLLEDFFEDIIDEPTDEQIEQLYSVFKKDFIEAPLLFNNVKVKYNTNKSNHPLFKGYPSGFEHICTRKSEISKKRYFDIDRANKITWIRPIIENYENNRIKYFEREHFNGQNQKYFWYEEKNFVVIIREIQKNLFLITAFSVDHLNKNKFAKWYKAYKK
jgi:hypothetical protein